MLGVRERVVVQPSHVSVGSARLRVCASLASISQQGLFFLPHVYCLLQFPHFYELQVAYFSNF